jgi:hypothetical protein
MAKELATTKQNLETLEAEHDKTKTDHLAVTQKNSTLQAQLQKLQAESKADKSDIEESMVQVGKLQTQLRGKGATAAQVQELEKALKAAEANIKELEDKNTATVERFEAFMAKAVPALQEHDVSQEEITKMFQ